MIEYTPAIAMRTLPIWSDVMIQIYLHPVIDGRPYSLGTLRVMTKIQSGDF
jgi:hypothetical protein